MITKYKIFEDKDDWKRNEGSYVILKDHRFPEFFDNNIGQITKVFYPGGWFRIHYDNVPPKVMEYIKKVDTFNIAHVSHISKNKEDLELILKANKYNL